MYYKPNLLVKILVIFYLFETVSSKFEFTNLNCTCVNEEFCKVEYCYLKSVNRSFKYLSLKVNMFDLPLSKIKKLNGYKPFLYNQTVNACKYLRSPRSYPVVAYFHDFFRSASNMNHTCPYNHDLIVDKLTAGFVNNHVTNVLPVPEGEYVFHSSFFINNILRVIVRVFATIS